MTTQSRIEAINVKLMALYDEREELQLDIDMATGDKLDQLEDQLHDLKHSIRELERQVHDYEIQHLDQMKEAV